MKSKERRVCRRCVMDDSAEEILFNSEGYCSFCEEFLSRSFGIINDNSANRAEELSEFISKVKKDGRGKDYDCIVGVSGGVDSSWVLVKAVELGLRPLAVHMDNGWNSELAQHNITSLVKKLDVDLVTHVIDWSEYRNLMQSFFDADVVDVELLYDNAMLAVNYQQASKFRIKHILGGMNQATEGMKMPAAWNHLKFDKRNIKAIASSFGGHKLNTFPAIGVLGMVFYEFIARRKWVNILDLMDFNKEHALSVLESQYGYKPYPYKHYESIFTRFYQGYLLPEKFGFDKRKVHFSTLIISGQMSRDTALTDLSKHAAYPSLIQLEREKEYFLKKMLWKKEDLQNYLSRPSVPHSAYPSEKRLYDILLKSYRTVFSIAGRCKNVIRKILTR
jgi:N-acetyl sugar amidotransferase